jgi:hypothetical protein
MVKHELNCFFAIGHRCNSIDFLKHFKLRKFSGPFDHLYLDFETSLKIINTKFEKYLYDIVRFNKNAGKIELLYKKHTTEINNTFYELLKNPNLHYMRNNYNDSTETFNQNFLDENRLHDNMYNWNTICCFHHHDLSDINTYNTIQKRVDRFNNAFSKYNETTSLFFITKIITSKDNIMDYMYNMIELKKKYNINCFIIVIIPCDDREDNHYYYELNKCLFIVKKVENYDTQYSKYIIDNNMHHVDFTNEYNIILKYFNLNLIEKVNL